MRIVTHSRKTKETDIKVRINLDGEGIYNIKTGIGFFDHMLEQLSKHSLIDIDIEAIGDLHIDAHHTVEDVAITLGQAINKALGEKRGISRFATSYAPMDETLSRVAIDLSGRPYTVWNVKFSQDRIGNMDSELFREWFMALANNINANIHIECFYGVNNHHIIESCFKALALALRKAITIDERKKNAIASTKGVI